MVVCGVCVWGGGEGVNPGLGEGAIQTQGHFCNLNQGMH